MKIQLTEPEGPYSCELDTGVMEVKITEAYNGLTLKTKDGEKLSISMRDNGFEICYEETPYSKGKDQWFEFKNGKVQRMEVVI